MRYFLSVGEPSGDLHAANLIERIKTLDSEASFVGFGGPKMQAAGCETLYDLTRLGVMFLSGVISNLKLFFRLIGQADRIFLEQKFDAVILIDYPGLNWWIARKATKHGIPVFYYGVPQMWAWAPWRIRKIRKFVDYVICKLPFEPKWFADRNCEAHYVGHPYFDELEKHSTAVGGDLRCRYEHRKTLLLLPGSRQMELDKNLGTLFSVARNVHSSVPEVEIVMGCLNDEHQRKAQEAWESIHQNDRSIVSCELYSGRTLELMKLADACVACSGSVSLELLQHRLPTVIVYKLGPIKMLLQAIVLRCKFITLPNLMNTSDIRKTTWWPHNPDTSQDSALMPEYMTWRDASQRVSNWIVKWLTSEESRLAKAAELDLLAKQFAQPGATDRAAEFIVSKLTKVQTARIAA